MTEFIFQDDKLIDCIHCGLCLPKCPSYAALGTEMDSPRGRVFLMRAVDEGRLELTESVKSHFDTCLACRGCETACPSGVDYYELLEVMQGKIAETYPAKGLSKLIQSFLLRGILKSSSKLGILFKLLYFYQQSGLKKFVEITGLKILIPKKLRDAHRFMPEIHQSYKNKYHSYKDKDVKDNDLEQKTYSNKAGFIAGCMMDYFYPDTNKNTVKLLEILGFEVVVPDEQHCCGAIHQHTSDFDSAKKISKEMIDAFSGKDLDVIVSNASGCGAMAKAYGKSFKDDEKYSGNAENFSHKTKDIIEIVAENLDKLKFNPLNIKVLIDLPCHLSHAQKIKTEPHAILSRIPGLEILPYLESDMCCGAAGAFTLTQPELSNEILSQKMKKIVKINPDFIVTSNIGCMIQFEKGIKKQESRIKVKHIIDIVMESLENN